MPSFGERPSRTKLEALIRERRQTFEEFSEEAERFAREHGEAGTLSARHVQRLASGQRADGRPLGPVRPATRRLLERMLGRSIQELLGSPDEPGACPAESDPYTDLRARLANSGVVDREVIAAMQQKVNLARVVDRRLGAPPLLSELGEQIRQMQALGRYSLSPATRQALAAVTADACALVGWQWLDQANLLTAWDCYAQANTAAGESDSAALKAYVLAGQAVVLLDMGDTKTALDMTHYARWSAAGKAPRLLASWLVAAYGEACAANGLRRSSLRAFDEADRLISGAPAEECPYLVFNDVHLSRWRGSALARLGDREAVDVLSRALDALDPTFIRAETSLRTDLVQIFRLLGEREAAAPHADRALQLAQQIGSVRHRRRIGPHPLAPFSRPIASRR